MMIIRRLSYRYRARLRAWESDGPRSGFSSAIRIALFAGLATLAACSGARRDVATSLEDLSVGLPAAWDGASAEEAPLSTHFVELIDDERLRSLIAEAMTANPDLRAAARRLEASRRLLAETRAARWPLVEANYSAAHSDQALDVLGENLADVFGGSSSETRHRVSLGVAWEVDVWGRLADLHDENGAHAAGQAADFAAARDALATRLIQAWVEVIALRQALTVETDRVEVLERLQATITNRYRRGIGDLDDLAAARATTELASAGRVALQDEHDRAVRALELLLGRPPRAALLTAEALPTIGEVHPGYPGAVLARRPDVSAALWRLTAADAGAAAAARAMLPGVRLTGDLYSDKNSLGDLLTGGILWGVVGSITQPIFQSGLLRARSEAR
ncbi:MAG: TolC family protein, partial [Gemmatimonadetes bacterium]|nr:TolC family protein [Gemmatimonadota bacterium]